MITITNTRESLEEALFLLKMKDHWNTEDWATADQLESQIAAMKPVEQYVAPAALTPEEDFNAFMRAADEKFAKVDALREDALRRGDAYEYNALGRNGVFLPDEVINRKYGKLIKLSAQLVAA